MSQYKKMNWIKVSIFFLGILFLLTTSLACGKKTAEFPLDRNPNILDPDLNNPPGVRPPRDRDDDDDDIEDIPTPSLNRAAGFILKHGSDSNSVFQRKLNKLVLAKSNGEAIISAVNGDYSRVSSATTGAYYTGDIRFVGGRKFSLSSTANRLEISSNSKLRVIIFDGSDNPYVMSIPVDPEFTSEIINNRLEMDLWDEELKQQVALVAEIRGHRFEGFLLYRNDDGSEGAFQVRGETCRLLECEP